MERPPRPLGAKDDDDPWGKLATDLFGVDFNQTPDFDFSELEPPAPVPVSKPQPPAEPEPQNQHAVAADTSIREPEHLEEPEEPSEAAAEPPRDPYWDALESWEWEEAASSEQPPRTERPVDRTMRSERPDRPREGRGASRERRERDDRRIRSEREDRPSRERPPREDRSTREDRSAREERPRSRPPEPRAAASPATPPRSIPAATRPEEEDDFAAGLLDDETAQEPTRPTAPPTPAPSVDELEEEDFGAVDEFEAELPEVGGEGEPDVDTGTPEEAPRRRRRRRRRRGRGGKVPATAAPAGAAPPPDDEELESDAEESFEEDVETEGFAEPREPEEEKRPRRRRRRRGGRDDRASVAETSPTDRDARADRDAEMENTGDESLEVEAEVVPRRSYESVPSWEEAISYLVRSRGVSGDKRGGRRPSR